MSERNLIQEAKSPVASPKTFALWNLGFRPFYLLASIFAALSIPLWALQFAGWLPRPYLQGPLWHAHEMLFGFTLAVMVGFLLTAGRNWANRPTPTGAWLAALALLWIAGRVLVLTPYGWAAAIVNAAFPLAVAVALAIPFFAARNRRNYFFVGLLVVLSPATLAVHLGQLGVVDVSAWPGIRVGLDLVLLVMVVMTGRVVPMFTNNGVPGAGASRRDLLEQAAFGSVLLIALLDALQLNGMPLAVVTAVAAGVHLWRWLLWRSWRTVRVPLVWVLHVACFWIPVHFVLRSFAAAGWIATSPATHALTVGAIGGLVIGMMTRTALGHTGRPLRARGVETACYLLVFAAAILRVFPPLVSATLTLASVLASAGLWSAAFALYAWRYWRVLTRPRLDGKPG